MYNVCIFGVGEKCDIEQHYTAPLSDKCGNRKSNGTACHHFSYFFKKKSSTEYFFANRGIVLDYDIKIHRLREEDKVFLGGALGNYSLAGFEVCGEQKLGRGEARILEFASPATAMSFPIYL